MLRLLLVPGSLRHGHHPSGRVHGSDRESHPAHASALHSETCPTGSGRLGHDVGSETPARRLQRHASRARGSSRSRGGGAADGEGRRLEQQAHSRRGQRAGGRCLAGSAASAGAHVQGTGHASAEAGSQCESNRLHRAGAGALGRIGGDQAGQVLRPCSARRDGVPLRIVALGRGGAGERRSVLWRHRLSSR